jgi:2'-5' RNA ligase
MNTYYFGKSPVFSLSGIGIFSQGRVVWTAPRDSSEVTPLKSFANEINSLFTKAGIVDGRYRFEPHATLMKVDFNAEGIKVVPPEIYLPYSSI